MEQRIGRYQILYEIASGGQGTVYRAFDPESSQVVAVKVLHPILSGDRTYIERFRREASLAASIDHPNVVRIFEVGRDGERHFMALEFLPESLARVIESGGQMRIDGAARFGAQVAEGLAAAHALGIFHRDVKPQNVLIGQDGSAKVTDFGIARGESFSTMTATGVVMGTPHYMSPEQARGERSDARSDVYSLGCMLYHMLAGEVPFKGDTPLAVIRQQIEEQPRRLREVRRDLPRRLESVVERAMAKDPGRRFQSAAEIGQALRAAVPEAAAFQASPTPERSTRPVAASARRPAPVAAPARPGAGPRKPIRWLVLGLTAVILIAAVSAAAYLTVFRDDTAATTLPAAPAVPPPPGPAAIPPHVTPTAPPAPAAPPAASALAAPAAATGSAAPAAAPAPAAMPIAVAMPSPTPTPTSASALAAPAAATGSAAPAAAPAPAAMPIAVAMPSPTPTPTSAPTPTPTSAPTPTPTSAPSTPTFTPISTLLTQEPPPIASTPILPTPAALIPTPLALPTETPTSGGHGYKLTTNDGAAGDRFGYSVAIDGETLVAGARNDDDKGSNSGSVYVFVGSGGSWNQQAKLTADDGEVGDEFGSSVAINGNMVVVGAPSDLDMGKRSGSVYVFVRSGNIWTQLKKLTASDGAHGDHFGESVAVSEETIVVGAPFGGEAGSKTGSAYIFVRTGSLWTQQRKLIAKDATPQDEFGSSVAINVDSVVVGAPEGFLFENLINVTGRPGKAYVFVRTGDNWSQQAKLTSSDGSSDDFFGASVAVSNNTVVVGSPFHDAKGNGSGSVYVFVRPTGGWSDKTENSKLTPGDGRAFDHFGDSVAISGDIVLIGSPLDDDTATDSGTAYLFAKKGSEWEQQQLLTAIDGAAFDKFGGSVAISRDNVIIATELDDDAGTDSGSGYVFALAAVNDQMSTLLGVPSPQWPMFRGSPSHHGRSPYAGPENPSIVWSFLTLGEPIASPAVGSDGTLYLGSEDGNFFAIAPNGELKWEYQVGGHIRASAALDDDGNIYVSSTSGELISFDPEGELRWRAPMAPGITSSSPTLSPGGTLYAGTAGGLYAFDLNGSLLWNVSQIRGNATPSIGPDGSIYLGSNSDQRFYSVTAEGNISWAFDVGAFIQTTAAIGEDGIIYFGANTGKLYALNPDGSVHWIINQGGFILNSPTISADGKIYLGVGSSIVGVNPDGTEHCRAYVAGDGLKTALIDKNGILYVGEQFGNGLFAVRSDCSTKWSLELPGNYTGSTPVIAEDGTLYIRSVYDRILGSRLHAIKDQSQDDRS